MFEIPDWPEDSVASEPASTLTGDASKQLSFGNKSSQKKGKKEAKRLTLQKEPLVKKGSEKTKNDDHFGKSESAKLAVNNQEHPDTLQQNRKKKKKSKIEKQKNRKTSNEQNSESKSERTDLASASKKVLPAESLPVKHKKKEALAGVEGQTESMAEISVETVSAKKAKKKLKKKAGSDKAGVGEGSKLVETATRVSYTSEPSKKKKKNKKGKDGSTMDLATYKQGEIEKVSKKRKNSKPEENTENRDDKEQQGVSKTEIVSAKGSQGKKRKLDSVITGADVKKTKVDNPHAAALREKLTSARFRYLNEKLYTSSSKESLTLFQRDPDAYEAYHTGFQSQVTKWPENPLDVIISRIEKLPNGVIADFGCGDARLAQKLKDRTVHSFDLAATNDFVTVCDMANTPLKNASVDIAVFCLSLMGTNLKEFILEANRVLKREGHLLIAEVTSRCTDIPGFLRALEKFGFKLLEKNDENSHFFFAKYQKMSNVLNKNKLPKIYLKACLYKKR